MVHSSIGEHAWYHSTAAADGISEVQRSRITIEWPLSGGVRLEAVHNVQLTRFASTWANLCSSTCTYPLLKLAFAFRAVRMEDPVPSFSVAHAPPGARARALYCAAVIWAVNFIE